MRKFLRLALVLLSVLFLPLMHPLGASASSHTPSPETSNPMYGGQGAPSNRASVFAGITSDASVEVRQAGLTGCWISVNNPFQVTASEQKIHGQDWITSCTSGITDCRVEVDLLKNGSVVSTSAIYYGCSINKRRIANYACSYHPTGTYNYTTRGWLSVEINGAWYPNAADSGITKYYCV